MSRHELQSPLLARVQELEAEVQTLKFELKREQERAKHYMDEWSDVCNENQVLLNKIDMLEDRIKELSNG